MMKNFIFAFLLYFATLFSQNICAQQTKIDSLESILSKTSQDSLKIELWNQIAFAHLFIQPDSSLFYAEKAEFLAKKIKNINLEYTAINHKGTAHRKKGNLAKAMAFFREGYQIAKKMENSSMIANSTNNIALIYASLENYHFLLIYLQKIVAFVEKNQDQAEMAIAYHNIGDTYCNLERYDSAEYFLLKSMPLAKKLVKGLDIFNYFILGKAKWKSKNYASAKEYLNQAIILAKKESNSESLGLSYYFLAEVNFEQNELDLAYQHALKALEIVEKNQIKANMLKVYQLYSKILEKKGDLKNALKYKDLFIIYKDSIQTQNTKNSLEVFEYESRQGEVALLKAEKIQKDLKLNEQKWLIYSALLALISMAIVVFAVLKSRKTIKIINKNLQTAHQEIQEKSKEIEYSNKDLQAVNKELAVTNEELYQTQEEIITQRDLLKDKNFLLSESYGKISKSIEAAKLIQKAILPSKAKMKELFEEHFVLFKPRDVVSGDFWWANEIEIESNHISKKHKFLIVADCTGHGVSGAMITMIGSALLDRIIHLSKITDPAEILEKLHEEVNLLLQQNHNKSNEGMDIAILDWYDENQTCVVNFASAKRPLYYTFQGNLEKIIGTRRSIGGSLYNQKPFEKHTLNLPKGSLLYLCSDGYADQNNFERRSFMERGLIETLNLIQILPMLEQKEELKQRLASHMNGTEQRDDILVIGIKI